MAHKVWTFELEDGQHTVELEHSPWSGRRRIRVDGSEVASVRSNLFDTGSTYPFQVGGHQGAVLIKTNGFTFSYDLALDGRSVTTGKAVAPQLPIPPWAWAFLGLCGLIPILAMGGAVPIVLGIGGVTYCLAVSRRSDLSVGARVARCVGATLLAWLLFGALILLAAAARQ